MNQYAVQLPVFEGPLDLLLELIERAELDITRVALAQVTDQYLAHLRQPESLRLSELSSFLVIAARLIQIKSEALLPRPPERAAGEEDPGDALARQLIAYKKYKQIAILLAERQTANLQTFVRLAPPPVIEPRLDLAEITIADLAFAYREALANQPEPGKIDPVVVAPRIRIRDQIDTILAAVRRAGQVSFRTLLNRTMTRIEVVVSFLAMLELVKQRQIQVEQEELFGDIRIVPGGSWNEGQDRDFELEFDE